MKQILKVLTFFATDLMASPGRVTRESLDGRRTASRVPSPGKRFFCGFPDNVDAPPKFAVFHLSPSRLIIRPSTLSAILSATELLHRCSCSVRVLKHELVISFPRNWRFLNHRIRPYFLPSPRCSLSFRPFVYWSSSPWSKRKLAANSSFLSQSI